MQRGRGNIIKTQNKYASPVKQAFATSLYDREGSLFQPVMFTGVEKKDVSEPGHFDQAMNTPTDQIIKNITSKKPDTKGKKKDPKKNKKKDVKTDDKSGGGVNPELLLAMTMPFSYAIGKGLSALFGRRKSKTQEIAEDGEKQHLQVNKELMEMGRKAQYKDPKTGDWMTAKQHKKEFERRQKPLGKNYTLGDLSGGLKL